MAKVIVQHHVADYDRWFPIFIEHGEVRRRHGATGHTVYRTAADRNTVLIVNDFASVADAQAFLQDPFLPAAMARAGVDVAPQVWIVNEAHAATY